MTQEARWLLDWFGQRGSIPGDTQEEQLRVNYFDTKLIDSLGVIELLVQIEEYFSIQFSERHFQDRRFSTLEGLSEIIAELRRNSSQP